MRGQGLGWLIAAALLACGRAAPDQQALARAAAVPDPALFGAGSCEAGDGFGPVTGGATDSAALRATYRRSCATCHAKPGAGAPLAHDTRAWDARLSRGMDALLEHTVGGIGGMPPMGLCMDCSEAEFRALIEFMAAPEPPS